MKPRQNYVSTELTHFVGGALKTREEQYDLLLKILRDGRLECREGSGGIVIDPFSKFSSNRMIRPDGVCFCDIPLKSLAIHMGKYSVFGLAFPKRFLVAQGANPVFYIASNSKLRFWTMADKRVAFHTKNRKVYFDKQFLEFYDCMREAKRFIHLRRTGTPEANALISRLEGAQLFLSSFFGYCKCFDASRMEDDKENYYMEREWRLRRNLAFKIGQVERVILPQPFVRRFAKDVPGFSGEERRIAPGIVSVRRRKDSLSP
jgi:Putative abortive phage resistance protein AbiGi, antitoxin